MTDNNLSSKRFIVVKYISNDMRCLSVINLSQIVQIEDNGKTIIIRLTNSLPCKFSGFARQDVHRQLIDFQVINQKDLPNN